MGPLTKPQGCGGPGYRPGWLRWWPWGEDDGGLAAWLESKRLLVLPERHIENLRRLIAEDEDVLLMYDYDLTSDPQTVAVVRASRTASRNRWMLPWAISTIAACTRSPAKCSAS